MPSLPTRSDPDTQDLPAGRPLALLTGTWAGRAVLIGTAVRLIALVLSRSIGGNFVLDVMGTAGTLALLLGLAIFIGRLIGLARRRLLWRVRRKLILSYIFVGLVPALLIIVFCLLCGFLLFGTLSQYMVETRMQSAIEQAQFLARTTAIELGRITTLEEAQAYLQRKQALLATRYPEASLAVVPAGRTCAGADAGTPSPRLQPTETIAVGPWPHVQPPDAIPQWVPCAGYSGLIAYTIKENGAVASSASVPNSANGATYLAVRTSVFADGPAPRFAVILDLPLNEQTVSRLRAETGITLLGVTASTRYAAPQRARPDARTIQLGQTAGNERFELPWVVFTGFADWETGRLGNATVSIGMSIREIYDRLSPSWRGQVVGGTFREGVIILVLIVGVLFLLIQFVALVVGLALARSITGSVHELFVGTDRVQHGDFSHRIEVKARDQLGELADSFNTMTSRLTQLLAEMAEKKRLEEELRIARNIQMSLLPQGPLKMPGLITTAHCSPAREVGGDYYDFLPLDEKRVGILIADVSGKGTSAALYMAELKGLMLSLSQIHRSPRALLIAADRIIADNLDNRSFITMTYAVIDLESRTMTYARAGHTPVIHLPAGGAVRRSRVLTTGGMVLGLKLDNGEKFRDALEEVTLPLESGDIFLLFTDGLSEAMGPNDELFGEGRLATIVEEHADLPFEELRERILREVKAFAGEPGPHDDMTLILLKVDDAGAPATEVASTAMAVS
jgi:sigma-B regulation protein RsbU (phosphoserine phosphatase)